MSSEALQNFARAMRAVPTDAEAALWFHLRANRFSGFKFKRQQPIGNYIVDFVCLNARLVVEVDGGQHNESASDETRDTWLKSQGFSVLRFWNNEVSQNLDGVLTRILEALSPSPQPLPRRGGGALNSARPISQKLSPPNPERDDSNRLASLPPSRGRERGRGGTPLSKITGLILAGGRGSRMGSVDKGLQVFRGKPMVAHVLERFVPQVDEILINANRSLDEYAAFGHRVVPDAIDGFAGPLAGLHIGMTHATHPLIVTSPCDSPFLPLDLVSRLRTAMEKENADLAVAKTFDQPHPVFCLTKASLAPHLQAFLESGQRKIDKWYASLKVVEVPFDDEEAAFSNINTIEELKSFEQSN